MVNWIVEFSVTFPNTFRNEQKSIFHAGLIWLRRMKHWNSKNKQTKTNQKGIISTSRFRNHEYVQKISCSFKRSPLLYIFLSTHHLSAREYFDSERKKLLIGLSPNSEIVKVELSRIKNAQTPPVGIDKSFLQTNQKKWDLTIREQTNCTAAFSTLNPLVVILFEVSWDKSWTVTSPYLADPSLGQYCG